MDLEGRVWLLQGRCPDLRFAISLVGVRTNRDTDFRKGKCDDIRNGTRLNVTGVVQQDFSVLATKAEIRDNDDDDD